MASYGELKSDMETLLKHLKVCKNGSNLDLQLAAELGKTLLERNKELETLLKSYQHQCEEQKQEIEYLTKQNLALKEVNDSRMQIYETLDISIRDLETEKHNLMVQTSNDKKIIKGLKQNIEALESRCEDLSKQFEEATQNFHHEKRKNERLRDSDSESSLSIQKTLHAQTAVTSSRHASISSSGQDSEEICTPTNPNKSFSSCVKNSSVHMSFMNFSQDFSSIQPVYSLDSHDSGFKPDSSNSAEHEEILKIMTELEDTRQQYINEHLEREQLEQEIKVLAQENQNLQSRLVQANTLDEMKSVQEELSFLEEVRQGQMCTRCLKSFETRTVTTKNTSSFIGSEDDEDDRSLLDLLNNTATQSNQPVFRSAVTIKLNDNGTAMEYSE